MGNKPKSYIEAYTDGSYSEVNGVPVAGYAVWFGDNHPDNYCGAENGRYNNLAEVLAIRKGLDIVAKKKGSDNYRFFTDSTAAYNMTVSGRLGPELPSWLLEDIQQKKNKIKGLVDFQLVKSHSGVRGNSEAHKLANRGRKNLINRILANLRKVGKKG